MQKELEFRGIPFTQLALYLEELGGSKVTESMPIIYKDRDWSATILSEEEISFTSVFKVNSIKILFKAEDEETLNEILKKYRKKTFRAGG
ncbi:hypothetical protein [Niallia sp. Krafla_26]|uniref:hypothetical protein n=1 Tax=Niallia sp. Krafla_26 TaxID=3064703 RepID=UPI003D17B09F